MGTADRALPKQAARNGESGPRNSFRGGGNAGSGAGWIARAPGLRARACVSRIDHRPGFGRTLPACAGLVRLAGVWPTARRLEGPPSAQGDFSPAAAGASPGSQTRPADGWSRLGGFSAAAPLRAGQRWGCNSGRRGQGVEEGGRSGGKLLRLSLGLARWRWWRAAPAESRDAVLVRVSRVGPGGRSGSESVLLSGVVKARSAGGGTWTDWIDDRLSGSQVFIVFALYTGRVVRSPRSDHARVGRVAGGNPEQQSDAASRRPRRLVLLSSLNAARYRA